MAINFPTSPVNGDIHTAQGIQWQWDATGGTWKCQGVTGVYTLGIASASSLGGIKIGNNLNISASTGVLDAVMNLNNESISELTDVTFNNVTLDANNGNGKVLAWSQTLQAFAPVDQTGGGGGGGGSSTFVGLTDTPGSMGTAGQFLTVNSGGNALEFTAAPAGTLSGLTDTDLTTTAPNPADFLTYTGTNWVPSPISLAGSLVDVAALSASDGDVLTYKSANNRWEAAAPTGGGGGSGLTSRTTSAAVANNVANGGSLIQDIKKSIKTKIYHEQPNPRNEVSHIINIKKNSKLFNIVKNQKIEVNSAHHQSIENIGKDFKLSALRITTGTSCNPAF